MVSAGVNTGGVTLAGHRVCQPRPEPSLGKQVEKMRILVPLFKGLGIKENLRRMLLAQATLEAHRQGDTIRVV